MRFTYEYRTSDNVRHKGVVDAPDRDAAFALLKARGVKAFGVEEAPGFFNKLFGKGKRWMAIVVLLLALAALLVALVGADHRAARAENEAQSTKQEAQTTLDLLDSPTRRPLIGDAAVIENGIRTGWASVFPDEGDQFLASFAVPGYPAAKRNVSESALAAALVGSRVPRDRASSDAAVQPSTLNFQPDTLESRQVRAIVAGMKKEINALLAQGWTLKEVGAALAKRQDQEIAYYQRAQNELDAAVKTGLPENERVELWMRLNNQLRKLGIRLLPLPEEK